MHQLTRSARKGALPRSEAASWTALVLVAAGIATGCGGGDKRQSPPAQVKPPAPKLLTLEVRPLSQKVHYSECAPGYTDPGDGGCTPK